MTCRNTEAPLLVRAAFTLLEMLIVVAIIVALAGVGGYYVIGAYKDSQVKIARSQVRGPLTSSVENYYIHHNDYPPALDDLLVQDPLNSNQPYLKEKDALIDPWGNPYQYNKAGTENNGNRPDIWSEGPQGKIGNWSAK